MVKGASSQKEPPPDACAPNAKSGFGEKPSLKYWRQEITSVVRRTLYSYANDNDTFKIVFINETAESPRWYVSQKLYLMFENE